MRNEKQLCAILVGQIVTPTCFGLQGLRIRIASHILRGLYKLNTVDLIAIVLTPNFEDLTSEEGLEQATEIMKKLTDYWLENPLEGLKRGAELLANQDKIKAMVTAKVIREGVDPDQAIQILDKVIEIIPTIKYD